MKLLRRKKSDPLSGLFSLVRTEVIDKRVEKMIRQYGKEYCLDIGCGQDKDDRFQTIDIDPNCNPDYVGDIRVMFAPSSQYSDLRADSALQKIPQDHFMVVRLKHLAEHIEWIYQLTFFEWVRDLLAGGGVVIIDTPNLEYITKIYMLNIELQDSGKSPKYPYAEHPDLDVSVLHHMQSWTNFKLFSGGSPGDYHYSCFDKTWLSAVLHKVGFEKVMVCNSATLRVLAYKSSSNIGVESLDDVISQLG